MVQGGGMAAELNISHDDLYADVRAYLLGVFPGFEVIQGYSNNVPLPQGSFVLLNIIHESDLSTNATWYDIDTQSAYVSRTVEVMMQIDFYGERAGEAARIFTNLWRDFHAAERLAKCKPLFCDNPKYMPITNERADYEQRWMVTAYLNYNPTIKHDQDFVTEFDIKTNPIIED